VIDRSGWSAEIERFHVSSPGLTGEVLKTARCRGRTPYEWLTDGVASADVVVDLGCGDGPTAPLISGRWVGVDRSIVELEAAAAAKSGSLVQGVFEHLPIRQHSVGTVLCSMSLMLAVDLDAAITEIGRVLRSGGSLRLLLPSTKPLTTRDRLRYLRLRRALGLASYFPPSPLLEVPETFLHRFGFAIVGDEYSRFRYEVATEHQAQLLIRSLYLPGVDDARRERAVNLARQWRGSALGIPLRRIVAISPLGP
jgi:ubiquinone/menaquinone biosynthesis C-methylase UbiE